HAYLAIVISPSACSPNIAMTVRIFGLLVIQLPSFLYVQSCVVAVLCYLSIVAVIFLRSLTAAPEEEGGSMIRSPGSLLSAELMMMLCTVTLCSYVHKMFRQKVEARLREDHVTSQLDAATALLHLTCDAVAELDSELRLKEHCPKLAAVLLRDKACMRGVRFTDLVSRGESLRAEENLTAAANGVGRFRTAANVFHTHLVDSCKLKLRTEVFQVKFETPDGEKRHLVGLRDFTDSQSLSGSKAVDAILPDARKDKFSFEAVLEGIRKNNSGSMKREASEGASEGAQSRASRASTEQCYAMLEDTPCGRDCPEKEVADGVFERVVQRKEKNILLVLDLVAMRISAASAPMTALLGLHASEVFLSEYSMELFERLSSECRQRPFLPHMVVSFDRMPIFCSSAMEITGSMQLAQGRENLQLILTFRPAQLKL
ncbi:unnamed protein product, partial [Effrenium voratum]